jgi:predicted RNA-binding protein YlxR (DUF448 family)
MLARSSNDELDRGPRAVAADTQRLCVATGTVKPVEEMIRFVIAPDGSAIPDLKRRLPGRGIWITATREALRSAIARKAFARGFKREVRAGAEVVETTERLIERAALDALSMAHKAGKVAIGAGKAEAALARDRVVALLHAADAAPDGVRKLNAGLPHAAGPAGIAVIDALNSSQLDLALGRSNVVHAALLAGPESETFLARVARLARFRAGTGWNRHESAVTGTRTGI